MAMKKILQYLFVIILIMIIGFYFIIFRKSFKVLFGDLYFVYFAGVFGSIFVSSFFLQRNNFFFYVGWAIFTPFAGSILGYAALFSLFIYDFGYAERISIQELIVAWPLCMASYVQMDTCQCFTTQHAFGGCGIAPP